MFNKIKNNHEIIILNAPREAEQNVRSRAAVQPLVLIEDSGGQVGQKVTPQQINCLFRLYQFSPEALIWTQSLAACVPSSLAEEVGLGAVQQRLGGEGGHEARAVRGRPRTSQRLSQGLHGQVQ